MVLTQRNFEKWTTKIYRVSILRLESSVAFRVPPHPYSKCQQTCPEFRLMTQLKNNFLQTSKENSEFFRQDWAFMKWLITSILVDLRQNAAIQFKLLASTSHFQIQLKAEIVGTTFGFPKKCQFWVISCLLYFQFLMLFQVVSINKCHLLELTFVSGAEGMTRSRNVKII